MSDAKPEWLIFNEINGQFWGPNSGGYFGLWGAGLYTEADARRLARNKDRCDRVHHISEYKDQIANMCGAFERLSAALDGRAAALDAAPRLRFTDREDAFAQVEALPVAADGGPLPAVCTPEINAQIEAQIDHDKAIFEAGYVHGQQCAADGGAVSRP